MEVVKEETSPEMVANDAAEEIIKPHQKQPHGQIADNQLQEQQQQNHGMIVLPETKEEEKVIETAVEKIQQVQQQSPQKIHYEEHDEYDDDDDEKETSQKLVIDIPEEDEEEKEDDEEDYDDVIEINSLPQQVPAKSENEKLSPPPKKIETIITLSDGEDVTANEAASKPGKIQKRRSMAAVATNDKEHFPLKRRKINAAGAPKLPQTGYLRFVNDRRESMRKEHPSKTYMEHNKMIGEEWHALPSDVKSSYLKAADMEKQRYVKELHSFLKSRPDILASELAKDKVRKTGENSSPNPAAATTSTTVAKTTLKDKSQTHENSKNFNRDNSKDKAKEAAPTPSTSQQAAEKSNKRKRTPTPPTSTTNATNNVPLLALPSTSTSSSSTVNCTPAEIPIFTNEFLEHNKIYDMELRSLRKSKIDLEQQNSVLEKHVENMKFGVEKMITENNELEEKNRLLEIYLDKLKRKLAMALGTLPLPTAPNGATVHNIEKYMQDLYKMSTSNSTGPATLNKAKDIIRKLDLQIHF